jgi:hypothetical protein
MTKFMLCVLMVLSIVGCKPIDPPSAPPAAYHSQDLEQCNTQPELAWCQAACDNKEIKGTFAWCLTQ